MTANAAMVKNGIEGLNIIVGIVVLWVTWLCIYLGLTSLVQMGMCALSTPMSMFFKDPWFALGYRKNLENGTYSQMYTLTTRHSFCAEITPSLNISLRRHHGSANSCCYCSFAYVSFPIERVAVNFRNWRPGESSTHQVFYFHWYEIIITSAVVISIIVQEATSEFDGW